MSLAAANAAIEARVAAEVAALKGLRINALRAIWRSSRFGPCPPIRAGDLLRRFLAEKIQQEAFGQDPKLRRTLDRLAKSHQPGKRSQAKSPPRSATKGAVAAPGAVLIREWEGVTHRVDAVQGGFVWNGQTYRSLSKITRLITGTNWNGPAFFGLRQKSAP